MLNEKLIRALQSRPKRRQQFASRDLKLHKGNQTPDVPVQDDEPSIRENEGDAWCRSMREMDEHLEDVRTSE